jgi:hypothetical protein
MIKFSDPTHTYTSVVADGSKWTSVTTLVSKFKKPFDSNIAYKNSKDPESKWYGIHPEKIKQIWKAEATRSTVLGTWYHKKREEEAIHKGATTCKEDKGWKYSLPQQLSPGVYPEFITYHPEYHVCGQIDRLEVTETSFSIDDYKSNKKIDTAGFRGKKLLAPIDHLEDCHFNHYALQLSLYAYIIQYHNPHLQVGELIIKHIKFKEEGKDKYGYPISAKDKNGDYIVESVTPIIVPYLFKEVKTMLELVLPAPSL